MFPLTDETKARIKAVIEAPESISFGEVAKIAGLDVTKDLRYSDLSGCDFSGDDLRGWNLTGCDLKGAKGINVTWDETTILTDAELGGSIFDVSTRKGGA